MNVDHEDELRIQAPPGAASASESRLQLDGTGLMPEAQERKQRTTHTQTLSENLKEKIFSAGNREVQSRQSREKETLICEQKDRASLKRQDLQPALREMSSAKSSPCVPEPGESLLTYSVPRGSSSH